MRLNGFNLNIVPVIKLEAIKSGKFVLFYIL